MHRWSDLPELRTGVLRRRVRAWAGPGSGPGPDIAMAAAYAAVVGAFLDEAVYTVATDKLLTVVHDLQHRGMM
ncbi:hypothetical protein VTN96DRAFT_434 [Rasamsonia emersonii]